MGRTLKTAAAYFLEGEEAEPLFGAGATLKIDGKNRVSIPASFREHLLRGMTEADRAHAPHDEHGNPVGLSWVQVVMIPDASGAPVIECMTRARLQELSDYFDYLEDEHGEDVQDLREAYIGRAHFPNLDDNGRVTLPAEIRAAAGLKDQAAFSGLGRTFQITTPANAPRPRTFDAKAKLSGLRQRHGTPGRKP